MRFSRSVVGARWLLRARCSLKVAALPRFPAPIAIDAPECASCRTFRPDVMVSTTSCTHAALCWICAHHVVEHDTSVAHAHVGECECPPEKFYPDRAAFEPASELGVPK